MKVLNKMALLFLWAMPFFSALAQDDLEEEAEGLEFVVLKNGAQLQGRVLREYDFSDYEKIEFQSNGGVKTFYPSDIAYFQLENGRKFESILLPEKEEVHFVQVLLTGQFRLLQYRGEFYVDTGVGIDRLKVMYRERSGDGKKVLVKFYISQLKIMMAGSCGILLTNQIDRSRLEEQDLINIMVDYHNCEKIPYQVHIKKIPLFRIDPVLAVGVGMMSPIARENTQEMGVGLSSYFNWQVEGGMRIQDFRKAPRFSLDLRLSYHNMNSTWNASVVTSSAQTTASDEFAMTTISIPFGINYSFFKRGETDMYMGPFIAFSLAKLTSQSSIVDFKLLGRNETTLIETPILEVKEFRMVPGFKVGANYALGSKLKGFAELQGQYKGKAFLVSLPNYTPVIYETAQLSLVTGIKF